MKHFFALLIIFTLSGFFLIENTVYGLVVPLSPEELFDQSQTILVGNVESINVLEFEKSSTHYIEEDGVDKPVIEHYILSLDEYNVDVEEFVKNPQNFTSLSVRQPTTSVPGKIIPFGGFELGDRVLFYIQDLDDVNEYSLESFRIPKNCDAKTTLKQPRIELRNSFEILQDGVAKHDNYVEGIPMEFVLSKDLDTLEGGSIDVVVSIRTEGNNKILFEKIIHSELEPCHWIASATWEFTPEVGNYKMYLKVQESENRGVGESYTGFKVVPQSPLKQLISGISADKIKCKDGLVLIQKYDGSPACVKPSTIEKLIDRNWTTSLIVHEIALKTMSKNLGPECSQHTILEIQNGEIDDECRQYLSKLSEEHKSEMESQGYSFDHEQNVWIKDGYPDTMMSIVDYYLQNQRDSTTDTTDSKASKKSWTASYYPGFLPLTSIDSFGKVHSIDIDQNNNVVVGTQTGNHNGGLHYLDKNGNEIWQKKTDKILGFVDISDDGSVITAYGYELTDGGARAYHNRQLLVFDKSGTELWRYPQNTDLDAQNKDYSSYTKATANDGNRHLIGQGNKTTLLDRDGNKIWESFISEESKTAKISQTQNYILVGTQNHHNKIDYDWGLTLLGMNGTVLWEKSGIDGQIISSNAIAVSSNDNYVSIGVSPQGDEGFLYVFDLSGELMWKDTTTSVISFTGFTDDEKHLVVITNEELMFYDIDGNLLWAKDIVFRPFVSSYYVAGRSPYEYQDLLLVFDYGGNQVFEYSVNSTISSIKISDDSDLLVMGTQGKSEIGPGKIFYFNQIKE